MNEPVTTMGTRLGRYTLIAEIGRGGMADVFLAIAGEPGGFNRLFVIKRPHLEIMERPELVRMFLHEARVAARLNHRNIVQVYDSVEAQIEDGPEARPLIVMEFLDGQPFSRLIRAGKGKVEAPVELRVEVLREVLNGLEYIHEFRDLDGRHFELVHRDVSPQNIFVTYDGQVKLLDFGITKRLNAGDETHAGFIKGKIRYMAPEQASNGEIDRRSDIFSVGMMLGQIILGCSLWADTPEMEVLTQLINDKGPPIPDVCAYPELMAICAKAVDPDPDKRYPTAQAMRADLDRWIEGRARFGPGELGGWLSERFSRSRDKLKALLAEYTTQAKSQVHAQHNLPRLRLSTTVTASHPEVSRGSNPSGPSSVDFSGSFSSIGSLPAPQRGGSLWLWILAAALLGGGIAFFALSPPAPAPTPDAAQPKAPSHHTLKIKVTPPQARIKLDGRLLSVGRYEGAVLEEGAEHALRLEAEGFEPLEMTVAGSGPQNLTLMLIAEPEPDAAVEPDAAAKPTKRRKRVTKRRRKPRRDREVTKKPPKGEAPKAAPPAPSGLTPIKKPTRTIDTTSPY